MDKLTVADLMKLEEYAEQRPAFRARVMAHKKARRVPLGAHLVLLFEDRLTIQYQVQEMLRIERIFERAGIEDELAAYNPLIPDGSNWMATCQIEFEDVVERQRMLAILHGIENTIGVEVAGVPRIVALADEDMERSNSDKTSAIHFLRIELPAPAIAALRTGAPLRFGVDHPAYRFDSFASVETRAALLADLD